MSTIKKTIAGIVMAWFTVSFAWAQDAEKCIAKNQADSEIVPAFLKFKNPEKYTSQAIKTKLLQQLNCPSTDDFLLEKTISNLADFHHFKYQQYHKGIRVEHATYTMHTRQERLYAMSGKFVQINETFDIQPEISEKNALQFALNQINATRYQWQSIPNESHLKIRTNDAAATYYPKGELVIIENPQRENRATYRQPTLAYKFDIYATQPLSRAHVYVDTRTGEIIHQNPIIKHAVEGICKTKYSGFKGLMVEQIAIDTFRLRDDSRGNGIITLSLNNGTMPEDATDFIDNDNVWIEWDNDAQDDAALDAHYGAQASYDFFLQTFNRNSFDNAGATMYNYVHFGTNQTMAIWTGESVFYGDGDGDFTAFTVLDIVAHEFAHGLCEHTANLEYSYEPGALNEGFSDIWAACVEYFAEPEKSTWLIGEDLSETGDILRDMSNPNFKNHPDTYGGNYWQTTPDNQGGVHTNSGVINHWFYLLAEGGEGTNDHGDTYQVAPVGIDTAAQIAYCTETVYLSALSNFSSARVMSIQAAEDLFGACSQAAISTADAWYAVGVGGGSACDSDGNYCHAQGNDQTYEWLANVTIGGFMKYSAASSYSDFTNYIIDLPIGDSAAVRLTPGYAGTPYAEQYRIWIDFNQDGDFEDADEAVFAAGPTNTFAEGTIHIPAWASNTTRMRVSMRYENAPPVCGNFDSGEVEDYTVRFFLSPTPTCDDGIQNGDETGIDCGGICADCLPENPYCEAAGTYSLYQWVDYVGTTATNGNSSGNDGGYRDFSTTIFGVRRGTTQSLFFSKGDASYRFYWRIYMDFNQDEDYDDSGELVVSGASGNSSILSANAVIPATAALGATRMRVMLSSDAETTPCGAFLYGEVEDYTIFVSNELVYDDTPLEEYLVFENEDIADELMVFPNPATDILQVELPDFEGISTAKIYDWTGRLVHHFEFETRHRILNVADWQTGMYLMTVECEGRVFVEKILKR